MTNLPLPDDHAAVLADLKRRVSQARYQAQRQVNTELIRLYRQIGKILAERTDRAAWGGKVIARLAADLRDAFPDSRGFSDRNLVYMRGFARGGRSSTQLRSNLLRNCRGATSWCSPQHAATVGLLLCTDKNDRVVRYSLATSNQPMAIASYDLLAPAEQAALPSEADLTRALE